MIDRAKLNIIKAQLGMFCSTTNCESDSLEIGDEKVSGRETTLDLFPAAAETLELENCLFEHREMMFDFEVARDFKRFPFHSADARWIH